MAKKRREHYQIHKEQSKENYQTHKEQIAKQHKEYYRTHKKKYIRKAEEALSGEEKDGRIKGATYAKLL
jgi:hypothetical protein